MTPRERAENTVQAANNSLTLALRAGCSSSLEAQVLATLAVAKAVLALVEALERRERGPTP